MGLRMVSDLVAHAGFQGELSAVLKFGDEFPFKAKQDVAFRAPMVGQITSRILDHANPDGAELASAPQGRTGFAFVHCWLDLRPVCDAKGNVRDIHERQRLRELSNALASACL